MKTVPTIPEVDQYLTDGCGRCKLYKTSRCKVNTWQEHLVLLRSLALECGLTEEYKWSQPCYTYNGANVFLVTAFKDYCCVAFFKGSLLKDAHDLLTAPGKNSQAARQARFTSTEAIQSSRPILKQYIMEAIEIEKAGLKVDFKAKNELVLPEELTAILDNDPEFASAFQALTPGKQRGYILYFTGAKQSSTRTQRIKRYRDNIMAGKNLQGR